jgi:hypothetical protein
MPLVVKYVLPMYTYTGGAMVQEYSVGVRLNAALSSESSMPNWMGYPLSRAAPPGLQNGVSRPLARLFR